MEEKVFAPYLVELAILFFEKAGKLDFPLSMSFLLSIYIKTCNVEKVEYWMDKLRKCKTAPKSLLEGNEKQYASFILEVASEE